MMGSQLMHRVEERIYDSFSFYIYTNKNRESESERERRGGDKRQRETYVQMIVTSDDTDA